MVRRPLREMTASGRAIGSALFARLHAASEG